MTNKQLLKKIEKIIEYVERHTEEGFGLSSENANKAEVELMDLIKEVVESVIPKNSPDYDWIEADMGYKDAIKEMKDNLDKLLKDENGHEIQK